jgi:hypothetical protein
VAVRMSGYLAVWLLYNSTSRSRASFRRASSSSCCTLCIYHWPIANVKLGKTLSD